MDRISPDRLRELIDAHGAALTLYARQWCWAPEDALQEALIELLRQDPAPDHPLAWLFKTVRRRAQNLARGEFCRMQHHRRAGELRQAWFTSNGDLEVSAEELAGMLAHLPSLEREIVVARVWGELPFARIAELVDISCSAAHRRYQRALEQLAEMIDAPADSSPKPSSEPQRNQS
ncbi:RNA polymerase sigma factor [Candidatus Laterigemmans baculatus]|uniref:RNA polymerase sigma factor n=1 Tax=Candidatus Laterigemmans baculatus TaxID=2770505 RepID=UPI0013DA2A7D|nr:sigma-70 family RNA polymerase sigma factor [Candidatus Laterigemmans baculatus]